MFPVVIDSGCDQNEAVLSVGYTSDKRDSAIYPTSGYKYDVSSEITLPLLDMQYYQLMERWWITPYH